MNKITKKPHSVAIVTHEATTGPAHDLRDFLIKRFEELLFVAHPLLFIPLNYQKSSYWQLYRSGEKIKEGRAFHWVSTEVVLYLKDVCYSIFWTITKIGKTEIFIGVNNMNAAVGIILKKMGLTKKVIFYCIDYVPIRFSLPLINNIYHRIDKFAVQHCDVTWNVSRRMKEARNKKWGQELGNQITVPIGIWYKRIQANRAEKRNPHEIIFVGTIIEKQGLDMCVEAVRVLKGKIKDIKLTIIGSGPYEGVIKGLVKKYKLEKYVEFLGYLPSHEDVEKRLSAAMLAVALYNPQKDMFTYYADPMKVKTYLACGLPVFITDVPYIAKQVEKKRCGIIVDYSLSDITTKIEAFFKDTKKMDAYRKNAFKFARYFDMPSVYAKALFRSYHLMVFRKPVSKSTFDRKPNSRSARVTSSLRLN